MAESNDPKRTSPVLQLLASGLQLWIRQQCDAVDSLEIERVELRSTAISVQVGGLLRGQPLQLEHPFAVQGTVALSGPGLSRSLSTAHWRGLGDHLADGLLGLTPLQELRIERDRLLLRAQGMSCETVPEAVEGRLELVQLDNGQRLALPADPNIQIDTAHLEGGLLNLVGQARVSP